MHTPWFALRVLHIGLILCSCGLRPLAAASPEASRRAFDIPAGEALTALSQFVAQSGAQLLYSADDAQGVRTNPVQGRFSDLEALTRLLAGTPLQPARDARTGTLTIRRAGPGTAEAGAQPRSRAPAADGNGDAADEVVRLSAFEVTTSEGGGYLHSTSTVATRSNRVTVEIPQSITVLTDDFLTDTGALNAEDAIAYVGNTFVRERFGEPGGTIMRGFEREGDVYVDGFRDVTYRRDVAAYERMEVVKGPPSAVQGRSGSSGLINWVTKKPIFGRDFAKGKLSYQDSGDGMYRVVLDGNRTVRSDAKGRLGVRAIAIYQRGDSWVDLLPDNQKALYPSIRWQRGDTEINLFGGVLESAFPSREIGTGPTFFAREFREKFHDPNLGGAPNDPISALNIRYGANPAGPASVRNDRVATGVASLAQKFNQIFSARTAYQFLAASFDRLWFEPVANLNQTTFAYLGVPGVWVPTSRGGNDRIEHRHAWQGDVVADYTFRKSVRSLTMAGFEWWHSDNRANSYALALPPEFLRVNLAAPFRTDRAYWANQIQSITASARNVTETESLSYYVQQEVDLFRRALLQVAWRNDKQENEVRNRISGARTATEDDTDSFRYGATVFLNHARTLSLYGVYSDQKSPRRVATIWSNLRPGDARIDDQLVWDPAMELLEAGFKGEFLSGRLSVMLAHFKMTKTGNLNTYSNVPTESMGQQVFAGVASLADSTNQGWEVGVVGNLTEALSLMGNLSVNDSEEIRVVGTQAITQRIHRVPDWDARLFAKWDLRRGQRDGFTVRAGVSSYADFEGTFNGIRTTLTSTFTRWDAGVNYRWRKYSFDLFVRNLTDAPLILFRGGAPRSVTFAVDFAW
jgi:outer membrane receptor for monomeric catechols